MANPLNTTGVRWLRVYNADALPAPPYALLAITGVDTSGNFTVTRPTVNNQIGLLLNGPTTIPSGAYGQAHGTFPAVAAYDDGGDGQAPVAGQSWGAQAGSWLLESGYSGFEIVGGAGNGEVNVWQSQGFSSTSGGGGNGCVLLSVSTATPQTVNLLDGNTASVYTASTWAFVAGSWVQKQTVWWLGQELPLDVRVLAMLVDYDASGVPIYTMGALTGAVEVTSVTPQTINLQEGGTVTGYAASAQVLTASGWSTGYTSWFTGLNDETPTVNIRYACTLLGSDSSGVPIWGANLGQNSQTFSQPINNIYNNTVENTYNSTVTENFNSNSSIVIGAGIELTITGGDTSIFLLNLPVQLKPIAGQTNPLLKLLDSGGNLRGAIGPAGQLGVGNPFWRLIANAGQTGNLLDLLNSALAAIGGFGPAGQLGAGTAPLTGVGAAIVSPSSSGVGAQIQGVSGQSGDLLQFLSSTASVLAKISAAGALTLPASATSGAGLNLGAGTKPTSPNNGDVVVDSSGNLWWYGAGVWNQASSGGGGGMTNPMTTLGDLIFENATPAPARLAGDTSNTRKFLRTQASGGVAQAPTWDTLQSGDLPAGTATNTARQTTGTTTSTMTTVVDLTNTNGLHGSVSLKNTDASNALTYQFQITDLYGSNTTTGGGTIPPSGIAHFPLESSSYGPLKECKVQVQDQALGSHATFDIWDSVVG